MKFEENTTTIPISLAVMEKSWAVMKAVKVTDHIFMGSVVEGSWVEMKELEDGATRKQKY